MHFARDFALVIDAQLILAILARLASAIGFRRVEQRDAPPHVVIHDAEGGFLRNLPPESRAAQPMRLARIPDLPRVRCSIVTRRPNSAAAVSPFPGDSQRLPATRPEPPSSFP